MAKKALDRLPHEITMDELKGACCEAFNVSLMDFKNPKISTRRTCRARQACWTITRKIKFLTFGEIACEYDRKCQNVMLGIKFFEKKISESESTMQSFIRIGDILGAKTIISKIAKEAVNGEK